jgi:hypothetical protein
VMVEVAGTTRMRVIMVLLSLVAFRSQVRPRLLTTSSRIVRGRRLLRGHLFLLGLPRVYGVLCALRVLGAHDVAKL